MKSYGTAFDSLFETYEGMRDRSEITTEIEAMAWIDDPGQATDKVLDHVEALAMDHVYHKGYRDALRWVTGGE